MRGVTLIELLVVLVIISIALSIIVPSVGQSYDKWTLRSTAQRTVALFRFASDTARRDGIDVVCYYRDHSLVLLRGGSVFKELPIPTSVTVRPEKPQGAVFLTTGQIIASEQFVLANERGRKVTIKFGPLPGQVASLEDMR